MKLCVIAKHAARWLIVALFAAIVLTTTLPASACPLCKEAVPENVAADGPQPRVADGYFWSILFMMAAPFTIVAAMGTTIYFVARKNTAPASNA